MLVFMAIIIFVFIAYFGTDRGSNRARTLAVIDGNTISDSEYYNEYSKMMDMVKQRYGGSVSEELLKQMNLKKMAFDNIISRYIIIAKARDLKIQISDDELKQVIVTMPALQTDGRFDNYKYKQFLRYNRMSAEDFESSQKVNLAASKIESIIREGIKISDQEVMDLYAMQNQKLNLSFVQITDADIKVAAPSESTLEGYLKANANEFRIPEQVKVEYLYFDAMDFAPSEISASEIQDYYNRYKDNYKSKDGKFRALDEVKNSVTQELKKKYGLQKAYEAAKKAHDTIYQENNFEAYAGKNNLKIHDFEIFALNKPPAALADIKDLATQLAALEKNDISKTLAVDKGYYLIRVKEKKAAYTPKLKDIEKDVLRSYTKSEQDKLAEKEAEAMVAKLLKGATLEQLASEKKLKIQETGLFQQGTTIPKLGTNPDAVEMIFSLSMKNPYVPKPLKINNTQVILKLKEQSELDMKDFEAKKDVYKKIAMNLKREEAIKSWLEGNKEAMIKSKRLKINKEEKDL